jgi:hypothetical protein
MPNSAASGSFSLRFGRVKLLEGMSTAIVRKDFFAPGNCWEVKVVSFGSDGISKRFNIEPI